MSHSDPSAKRSDTDTLDCILDPPSFPVVSPSRSSSDELRLSMCFFCLVGVALGGVGRGFGLRAEFVSENILTAASDERREGAELRMEEVARAKGVLCLAT